VSALKVGMLETAGRWTPHAVGFASALNISALNLGSTLGETLGSALVAQNDMALTPWTGVALGLIAQGPLAWLMARSQISPAARTTEA
jgi:DHA1 family inner membrane transport protein